MHSIVRRVTAFYVWAWVMITAAGLLSSAQAELRVSLESPLENDTVAGVAVIRGWAFDTESARQISSVELFVDGVSRGNIACCTARADVQAAFPNASNALSSGFGLTINWGELAAGTHAIRVEVRNSAGTSVVTDAHTITVVKLGGFSFLNQFSVDTITSFAQVEDDNTLCVENVQITDKSSGATKSVKGIFRWQEACQCLALLRTEEDGYCDF